MPAESETGRLDPVRILRSLPQPEQGAFLDAYRQAVTAAQDPEGFVGLMRLLRMWSLRAAAVVTGLRGGPGGGPRPPCPAGFMLASVSSGVTGMLYAGQMAPP